MSKIVVIVDFATEEIDVYKDVKAVSDMLGMPRTTLHGKLSHSPQMIGGKMIGYGELHKSNRGGFRTKIQDND